MNKPTVEAQTLEDKQAYRHQLFVAFLAMLMVIVTPFSSDNYLPSLPAMARYFGTNASMMQLTISAFFIGVAISQLFYGPLSDRYGRRRIILIGLLISCVGSLFCAAAFSPSSLIASRFIQGVGAGVCNCLFRAVMRDIASGSLMAKLHSLMSMMYSIAPAAAPIVGGYIEIAFGWRANFIFVFIFVSSIVFTLWRYFPETNKQLNPNALQLKVISENYLALLRSRIFMCYTICSSFALAGTIAYCTASPFLFQNILHLSPVQYGWVSLTICLGLIIGMTINTKYVMHFGFQKMLLLGLGTTIVGSFGMYILGAMGILTVSAVLIPLLIYIVGTAMIFANATAGAFQPFAQIAGSAGAMFGCIQVTGTFIVSSIVSFLPHSSQLPLAITFIILSVGSIAILYVGVLSKQKATADLSSQP